MMNFSNIVRLPEFLGLKSPGSGQSSAAALPVDLNAFVMDGPIQRVSGEVAQSVRLSGVSEVIDFSSAASVARIVEGNSSNLGADTIARMEITTLKVQSKILMRPNVWTLPSGRDISFDEMLYAVLRVTTNQANPTLFTRGRVQLNVLTTPNANWVENEVTWSSKSTAAGAWAGAAGCSKPGVDYIPELLGEHLVKHANAASGSSVQKFIPLNLSLLEYAYKIGGGWILQFPMIDARYLAPMWQIATDDAAASSQRPNLVLVRRYVSTDSEVRNNIDTAAPCIDYTTPESQILAVHLSGTEGYINFRNVTATTSDLPLDPGWNYFWADSINHLLARSYVGNASVISFVTLSPKNRR